ALLTTVAAAAAVGHAVSAGAVPGHPHHGRTVVVEVGGPPVLLGGEHLLDVGAQLVEVDLRELPAVVVLGAVRVGGGRVLGEHPQVQPVRPPAVRRRSAHAGGAAVHDRALAGRSLLLCLGLLFAGRRRDDAVVL